MKATPDDCVHLTVDIVKEIHRAVIEEFGGRDGLHDEGLLSSAVGAPQSTFGGRSPYADIVEIGAAYPYYLCRNHAFNDGNKRVAMIAAIVFLRLNGIETQADSEDWEKLMLDLAASHLDRERTTARVRQLVAWGPKQSSKGKR